MSPGPGDGPRAGSVPLRLLPSPKGGQTACGAPGYESRYSNPSAVGGLRCDESGGYDIVESAPEAEEVGGIALLANAVGE